LRAFWNFEVNELSTASGGGGGQTLRPPRAAKTVATPLAKSPSPSYANVLYARRRIDDKPSVEFLCHHPALLPRQCRKFNVTLTVWFAAVSRSIYEHTCRGTKLCNPGDFEG